MAYQPGAFSRIDWRQYVPPASERTAFIDSFNKAYEQGIAAHNAALDRRQAGLERQIEDAEKEQKALASATYDTPPPAQPPAAASSQTAPAPSLPPATPQEKYEFSSEFNWAPKVEDGGRLVLGSEKDELRVALPGIEPITPPPAGRLGSYSYDAEDPWQRNAAESIDWRTRIADLKAQQYKLAHGSRLSGNFFLDAGGLIRDKAVPWVRSKIDKGYTPPQAQPTIYDDQVKKYAEWRNADGSFTEKGIKELMAVADNRKKNAGRQAQFVDAMQRVIFSDAAAAKTMADTLALLGVANVNINRSVQ